MPIQKNIRSYNAMNRHRDNSVHTAESSDLVIQIEYIHAFKVPRMVVT